MAMMAPRIPGQPALSVRALLEAGVHFGHQTKRWNPKMRQYIYGSRNGTHIIDLDQTAKLFNKAFEFVLEAVGRGGNVLFVGTKRQAQEIVQEEALRAGMFFVNNRWLGGTLTNFRTIKQGLDRLRSLERMQEDGTYEQLPKKEVIRLEKERARLEKYLGGLKNMGGVPGVVFIVDPAQEKIAVHEARKIGIPVVAITDTNCDPDEIDFVIPGNDDAIRSIKLIAGRIADACQEGAQRRKDTMTARDNAPQAGADPNAQPQQQQPNRPRTQEVYRGRPQRGGGRGGPQQGQPS
ncbi:MAG: 30S ribosomal protein S2 [Deltaproteobacteria bacterium]|nr:30S ribosomal protein S2 [Deltaproteobacteria bacterium]